MKTVHLQAQEENVSPENTIPEKDNGVLSPSEHAASSTCYSPRLKDLNPDQILLAL